MTFISRPREFVGSLIAAIAVAYGFAALFGFVD